MFCLKISRYPGAVKDLAAGLGLNRSGLPPGEELRTCGRRSPLAFGITVRRPIKVTVDVFKLERMQ